MSYMEKNRKLADEFEKLRRNRLIICNSKGQIRKQNKVYRRSYQMRVDEILELFSDACTERTTALFYWDGSEDCKLKRMAISKLWMKTSGEVEKIIYTGSPEDLLSLEEKFVWH